MPHILLEGPVDLISFFTRYEPLIQNTSGEILKLQTAFINQARNTVLIEALAVEAGPPNRFFVQVGNKDRKTTVRIYPGSDPEKTPGTKKLLALVAKQLKDQSPDIEYGSTNLKDFLL